MLQYYTALNTYSYPPISAFLSASESALAPCFNRRETLSLQPLEQASCRESYNIIMEILY